MPNMINTELASWTGDAIIGPSGDVYRIDDATHDGLDVRVWVWNAKSRDLDELDTPAGTTPKTREEALTVIEAHTLAALAAQEPAPLSTDEQKQINLRNAAAKDDRYFAGILNAVNAIADDTDRRAVLTALDTYRVEALDRMSTEYWVFPGVPISRIREVEGGDNPLSLAEEDAASWAEKTRDQATVVSVRVEKHSDGTKWSPALYFQFQGVRGVTEEHLRSNPAQERLDD